MNRRRLEVFQALLYELQLVDWIVRLEAGLDAERPVRDALLTPDGDAKLVAALDAATEAGWLSAPVQHALVTYASKRDPVKKAIATEEAIRIAWRVVRGEVSPDNAVTWAAHVLPSRKLTVDEALAEPDGRTAGQRIEDALQGRSSTPDELKVKRVYDVLAEGKRVDVRDTYDGLRGKMRALILKIGTELRQTDKGQGRVVSDGLAEEDSCLTYDESDAERASPRRKSSKPK